jgi:coatomer protein complex subunit gamma
MKQAIVDKNPMVAASALVAGLQLMHKSPEIVRRW